MTAIVRRPIRIEGDLAVVPLTRGYEAIIDAADVALVSGYNWCALVTQSAVYALRAERQSGKLIRILLHRVILKAETGCLVDHIDGNGLNNSRVNLRPANYAENSRNAKCHRNSVSGFKGVSWHAARGKWRARISVGRKETHLGLFESAERAHDAYCEAASRLYGEFARTA